ncbi:manganese efflux pump MntP family protein [Candidatus Stoquefichus massiliensis]|uniref:manganese efflux pump MntP n=1 Tax=Candidatus Stoquefichus massiliensis TaxID=1470350 RepID=UPI000480F3BC|nr:manganese efflux pump MntP family protein [Candidatus Stoquefichus massiliensis]
MEFIEIVIIGVGLAMDAFAVSVCKGLSTRKLEWKHAFICGGYFGFFQGMMPLIGYFLGIQFKSKIESIDHWIAFILLGLIGLNMIKEAFGDEECCDPDFSFKAMLPLAVATSIDALAIGVTFAFLNVNIFYAVTIIAITTFIISMAGVKIGHVFGSRYKSKAEIAGGIILILMGLKILLEHLNIFIL